LILRQQPGTAQKIIILNYLTNNEKKTFFWRGSEFFFFLY
jgi:hypothetical protein